MLPPDSIILASYNSGQMQGMGDAIALFLVILVGGHLLLHTATGTIAGVFVFLTRHRQLAEGTTSFVTRLPFPRLLVPFCVALAGSLLTPGLGLTVGGVLGCLAGLLAITTTHLFLRWRTRR